jgi:hypothetical protein
MDTEICNQNPFQTSVFIVPLRLKTSPFYQGLLLLLMV